MQAKRITRTTFAMILALSLASASVMAQGTAKHSQPSTKSATFAKSPALTALALPQLQEPATEPAHPSQTEISFTAVGDVMLGSAWPNGGWLPPDDGTGLLAEVAPILSASDITFGNLEGPMVDDGTSTKCPEASSRCYAFRVPTRYGRYLKEAGFDVMSLANNHALDFGAAGRQSSKRVLDSLGIAHSGEVGDIAHLRVKGKQIALIAFTTYDTSYNLNNLEMARQLVRDLATRADLVVVSFHGGGEGAGYQHVPYASELFLGENRGNLRQFAHAVIDAGAALVIGHGPHVVRGMEIYRGHLIAYSLGNFATYGSFNLSGPQGLSLILQARLAADGRFLGGRIHPVRQERPGGPRLDPNRAIIPLLTQLSQQDFGASAVRISADGVISPPAESAPLARDK
jgi:poly-gamma-glutamate capsule biosynthesis protein CapA/YwtB (metallophosphatase superfamily)